MVVSIATIKNSGRYYVEAQAAYYLGGTEPIGRWHDPHGVVPVPHGADIDSRAFLEAMAGRHPRTGEALTRNVNRTARVAGFDVTFSAPKSVSVVWALGDLRIREGIEAAQAQAVERSLEKAQEFAGKTRRGKDGVEIREARFFAVSFQHGDARPHNTKAGVGDPQLHTHSVLVNAAHDSSRWGTLDARHLFRAKMTVGRVYRHELSAGLRGIGFTIQWREKGLFEIRGVPRDLVETFSKRRGQIVEAARGYGVERTDGANAARAAGITRSTRAPKAALDQLAHRDRFEAWADEARRRGYEGRLGQRFVESVRERGREELLRDYRAAVLASVRAKPGTAARSHLERDRYVMAHEILASGLADAFAAGQERRVLSMDANVGAAIRELAEVTRSVADEDGAVVKTRANVLRKRTLDGRNRGRGGEGRAL